MPVYVYQCPEGHVTELVMDMASDKPERIACDHPVCPTTTGCDCDPDFGCEEPCGEQANRVFLPPAAIHYKGAGTYTTDYKMKYDRKRRKMPADDLAAPA